MKVAKNQFIKFNGVIPFEESNFKYPNGAGWRAKNLVEYAKKENLKPFKLHFDSLYIGFMPFTIHDIYDFITHCKRVHNTDTKYPVIMDEAGTILDGWHRIVKAMLAGEDHIMAVRFETNPPLDFEGEDDADK